MNSKAHKASSSERLTGLDSLRALAIVLVLIYHYRVVVSKNDLFGALSQTGWLGVDLFFVLSGYLIGNQVIKSLQGEAQFSLKLFYVRRLLRTLPNYWVILALYFLVPSLQGKRTAALWEFLTFTQNSPMRPGETFTHSWSLCIEEWFYLCLPIVLLGSLRVMRSVKLFWALMTTAFLTPVVLRALAWQAHGAASITAGDYWQYIYYPTVTRFDELLPGVAIAAIKNMHPQVFAWFKARGNLLLLLGLLNFAAVIFVMSSYFFVDGYGFSGLIASVGYSWIALTFALLTLAALSPQTALARVPVPGATHLALWSYAIYLIHKPIYSLLMAPLKSGGLDLNSHVGALTVFIISIATGVVLYWAVETPFMKLREKYFSIATQP